MLGFMLGMREGTRSRCGSGGCVGTPEDDVRRLQDVAIEEGSFHMAATSLNLR